MKNLLSVLFLLTLFMLVPLKVNAICIDSELARLKSDAAKAKITYDYLDNNLYSITIENITLDFFVKQTPAQEFTPAFNYSPNGFQTMEPWQGGQTITFNYYASYDTVCSYSILKTTQVTLPKANQYYGQPICVGLDEYYLCKKFTNTDDYTQDEILDKIDEYALEKETKEEETKEEQKIEEQEETIIDKAVTFFFDNFVYIMLGIIILSIGGIGIIKIIEKRRSII